MLLLRIWRNRTQRHTRDGALFRDEKKYAMKTKMQTVILKIIGFLEFDNA